VGSIRLLSIPLFGHHGVSRAERETGTLLEFDVELDLDLEPAAASDRVGDTVDYMAVHEELRTVVRDQRFNLLESLAGAVADRLLARFGARRAVVRVRKSNLPLSGGRVEVELAREAAGRRPVAGRRPPGAASRPPGPGPMSARRGAGTAGGRRSR
jgi:dihydroneopterin aldolase